MLKRGVRKTIDPGWILLDNNSTADVLIDPQLVYNIRHVRGGYIKIHQNAGKRRVAKGATLKVYETVWFYEGDIANILSFSSIREKHPVHYDTEGNYFSILKPYNEVLIRYILSGVYF